jgi:hypothetical protein
MESTVIGALIAVGGVVLGSLITFLLQVRMIRYELRRARAQDLYEERLVTLQNMIFACDWILRVKNHEMTDDVGKGIWDHVSKQNVSNLAFVPRAFREDFEGIIRALFAGHALENRNRIDYDLITKIRANLLRHIDEQFEGNEA